MEGWGHTAVSTRSGWFSTPAGSNVVVTKFFSRHNSVPVIPQLSQASALIRRLWDLSRLHLYVILQV